MNEYERKMAKLGFMGIMVPREFGGLGMGHIARTIVLEEIGHVSAAMANTLQIVHLGISPIVTDGTDEQKKKWLPVLARERNCLPSLSQNQLADLTF